MSYPINYPTPQGADVQIFSEGGTTSDWVKPQGASFIWFTLIGGGGGADSDGGGSGAVTNCLAPAFLIPDVLSVSVGARGAGNSGGGGASAGGASTVDYRLRATTTYNLLTANGGTGAYFGVTGPGQGGTASTSNYFSAAGFFQSVAGQNGSTGGGTDIPASTTTFLSGGGGGSDGTNTTSTTPNYGYPTVGKTAASNSGFFQLSPIIVGCGGGGSSTFSGGVGGNGGIGCGGGGRGQSSGTAGNGGPGLVVIISW